MIRQLGNPTWFASFSATETKWPHLLKILGHLIDKKEYSDKDINDMTWEDVSPLIKSGPVTCARHFDYMIRLFFQEALKRSSQPIGNIVDFFYHMEFQHRGSPHIHAMVWVEGAPQYGNDSNETIVEFVNKYITCSKKDSEEIERSCQYSDTDMPKAATIAEKKFVDSIFLYRQCEKQFDFPVPPMWKTMILSPLSEPKDTEGVEMHSRNYENFKDGLDKMKFGEDITFDQFLHELCMMEDEYT